MLIANYRNWCFHIILVDFLVDFFASTTTSTARNLEIGIKTKNLDNRLIIKVLTKSGWLDSNQRPHAPQTRTLTGLSYIPLCFSFAKVHKKKHIQTIFTYLFLQARKNRDLWHITSNQKQATSITIYCYLCYCNSEDRRHSLEIKQVLFTRLHYLCNRFQKEWNEQ